MAGMGISTKEKGPEEWKSFMDSAFGGSGGKDAYKKIAEYGGIEDIMSLSH
jgi:hypothetical protein